MNQMHKLYQIYSGKKNKKSDINFSVLHSWGGNLRRVVNHLTFWSSWRFIKELKKNVINNIFLLLGLLYFI